MNIRVLFWTVVYLACRAVADFYWRLYLNDGMHVRDRAGIAARKRWTRWCSREHHARLRLVIARGKP